MRYKSSKTVVVYRLLNEKIESASKSVHLIPYIQLQGRGGIPIR